MCLFLCSILFCAQKAAQIVCSNGMLNGFYYMERVYTGIITYVMEWVIRLNYAWVNSVWE